MGNKHSRSSSTITNNTSRVAVAPTTEYQIDANLNNSLSGRSFASVSSRQSTYSVSRPWSRVSRRRWKESTLTLPYEASKTAWPVSQLESYFLPEFPIAGANLENKFDVVQEVAKGAFGKVYKVAEKETGGIYALKVLSKSKVIKENAVQQVKEEVQIQRVCGHFPFIVNCPFYWQSRRRLYIVSDFISGGELLELLRSYCVLPVVLVQIYIAQIAFTLDFLHNAGIIYRDLKPENILLDKDFNLHLIDFGLAKWLPYGNKTKTLCGTLRYMAPEVIGLQPYGHAADWWSLGVLACLMLTNKYPTSAVASDNDQASEVTKKPGSLPEGLVLDVAVKDLLLRLLEVDPSRRLRSLRTLQTIAFYKGFDFEKVRERKVNPKEILLAHYPDGPPYFAEEDAEMFEAFESEPVLV